MASVTFNVPVYFVVGKIDANDHLRWEFQGMFSDLDRAVKACRDWRYFVAPAIMNAEIPEDMIPWPDLYYPIVREAE